MLDCDVFVAVAASLTRETVLFNVNKNFNNMRRPTSFAVLFTVSLSFVVCRHFLLVGVNYALSPRTFNSVCCLNWLMLRPSVYSCSCK